ncbi:MAG TPA: hypothetical protein VGV59_06565 [Pyrinomonadaceae bacterium]|nr:hypothetical protein [Pyrinomonadaceae bacterium]
MKHLLAMTFFAALIAVAFGILGREGTRERTRYGLKIFLEFMGVGLGIAWLLYWIP